MHTVDGTLVLSPSDLVGFLACEHLTQLELAVAGGELARPERVDPELDLLARKGEAHETAQLERLAAELGPPITIADRGNTLDGLRAAEAETLAAMRAGVPLIYQAAFFDGRWRGRADFLLRVEEPSDLGSWSYEVADAKLARTVRVAALLQMCEYSGQVTRLQGRPPDRMHVVLGTGEREPHPVADYDSYFRAARARFENAVDGVRRPTYPDPVAQCARCSWFPACEQRRRADDHLSLVAGMRRDHTRRLVEAGISTVAELAVAPADTTVRIGDVAWERLRRQASLQLQQRTRGAPCYELIDRDEAGLGLAALPAPSPGDLFFDIEGDPYVEGDGLEYLFGITEVVDGNPVYRVFWAHDRAAERTAFEQLIDFISDRWARDPSLHVYHYAQYEPVALKRLMGRHATCEDELDRLLRGGVFVDLFQVVRQGVRISREDHSLKSLETFYMRPRTEAIAEGMASIVAYERWRDTHDEVELTALAEYNEFDCESTWRLRAWLEERRNEWATSRGRELPRPEPRSGEPGEKLLEARAETRELEGRLTDGLPDDAAARTEEEAGRWLLAQLLDWHRREDKAAWWAHYDRLTKTDEELVEDRDAIGEVRHDGEVRKAKRSTIHRYRYDGSQDHKIDVGKEVLDPRTDGPCGKVLTLDDDAGVLELTRGPSLASAQHPRSLLPPRPIPTDAMRDALSRVARWVIEHGVDAPGPYRAGRDLLLGRAPRIIGIDSGSALVGEEEDPVDATERLVASLDHSCLAVQGPPGSGKTYTGARMIVDQVRRGRRVGVCATSHRAIGELLDAVSRRAKESGMPVRILQKCDERNRCAAPGVDHTDSNAEIDTALRNREVDVVAGTSWLFSRGELERRLDVVVVDEASQMSLANAVAVACAGANLVLLGDPQQLSQPSQGIHPPGADASALGHLLGEHETIPPDRGVFLATTLRLHPSVCRFVSSAFYEGRLSSHPDCERQRIDGGGPLSGAGLRLVPVEHAGNRTSSPEEVDVVRHLVDSLLDATWTDARGESHTLGFGDILVVAPYNMHVRRLREGIGAAVRVGTVDRFQGQQAPVTIYAMATSSSEDVPRNLEFLFSRERLNVAVSRAQAVSVIVCSSSLFHVGCRTPEQLRLVNALCRYAEMATAEATVRDRARGSGSAGRCSRGRTGASR